MELIALQEFSPDCSLKLKVGDRFEMSASSARLLIAMKKARPVNATVGVDSDGREFIQTQKFTPENLEPKRKYKRRDMEAED